MKKLHKKNIYINIMNRTLGLDSPIKTTTIEKESIRWLRLNKYSKKLYHLKKMEDEGYDELL